MSHGTIFVAVFCAKCKNISYIRKDLTRLIAHRTGIALRWNYSFGSFGRAKRGALRSAPLFYANARGLIRLRLLRREDTLTVNTSNKLFISVTAVKYEKRIK